MYVYQVCMYRLVGVSSKMKFTSFMQEPLFKTVAIL